MSEAQEATILAIQAEHALLDRMSERDPYRIYLSDEYPDPENLLQFGDSGTMPKGEITAIAGKAKTGKSFAVSILVASVLGCTDFGFIPSRENAKVLYFDTEQGDSYVARIIRRIHRLLGWDIRTDNPRLIPYKLREQPQEERFNFILDKVSEYEPNLIIIDGIADLVFDFNDVRESTEKVVKLLDMCSRFDVAILTVLHENKSKDDRNMKGHLGTMLLQKCACVFHLEKKGDTYTVTNTDCRNRPIEAFAFLIDDAGLPRTVEAMARQANEAKERMEVEDIRNVLAEIFAENDSLLYTQIKKAYMEKDSVSEKTAKRRIDRAKELGILVVSGGIYTLRPDTSKPPNCPVTPNL